MTPEDVTDRYLWWLNDFETTKFLEIRFGGVQTRKSVEEYIDRNLAPGSSTWHFGIFDEGDARLVGTVTFNHVDRNHQSASISFVIGHPEVKGNGYATEAVHVASHYMFEVEGFVKLYGGYYSDHKASERVFLKNGYRIEGRLRRKLRNYMGERVDHVYVGILKEEFKAQDGFFRQHN